jgi:hypothetical protein
MVEEEGVMKEVVTNYFIDLFSSNAGSTRVDELLSCIESRVTPAMNEFLCKEFNAQEVKDALDSIGDLKAPSVDGMPSIFTRSVGT